MLYKYPQQAFPYRTLIEENGKRGKDRAEFDLMDTGVFDDDRYFDVFVEYAKAGVDDILMLVSLVCTTEGRKMPRCISCRNFGSATPGAGIPMRPDRHFPPPETERQRKASKFNTKQSATIVVISRAMPNYCS